MARNGRPAFTYMACEWIHESANDPVLLYSELDDERWETRKVEVFRDGSKGWADAAHEVVAGLGEVPVPPLTEIAADPQFRPRGITVEEFEAVWGRREQRDARM